MKKRGQAATEFLTTYGWMILIIIIVLGAIGSLNLFKPKAPDKCDATSPIFCSDVKLSANAGNPTLTLILSASGTSIKTAPQDLRTKVTSVILNNPATGVASATCLTNTVGNPSYFSPNIQNTVTCNTWNPIFTLIKDKRISGTATVEYVLLETETLIPAVWHKTTVVFSANVQS